MSLDAVDPQPIDHGAWMKPGVFEVATGVWRIPLPLPMADLSCVNSWLLVEGDDVVLVDPGWSTTESERVLENALRSLDLGFADVREILVTHAHWDHIGLAIDIRERFGTPILLGAGEKTTIDAFRPGDSFFELQSRRLFTCGAQSLAQVVSGLPPESFEVGMQLLPPSEWLADGRTIALGEREITAHATPGHTRGHMVFSDPTRGVMITGDHILPRITPSIGLELRPEAFPLRSFMTSLAFVKSLPDAHVLPAHGNISASVHKRADELLAHHEARFDVVTDLLRVEPASPMQVAERMKWTRRERSLDDLAPKHQMAAVLEIAAHLDVLSQRGRVRSQLVDEIEIFEAA